MEERMAVVGMRRFGFALQIAALAAVTTLAWHHDPPHVGLASLHLNHCYPCTGWRVSRYTRCSTVTILVSNIQT